MVICAVMDQLPASATPSTYLNRDLPPLPPPTRTTTHTRKSSEVWFAPTKSFFNTRTAAASTLPPRSDLLAAGSHRIYTDSRGSSPYCETHRHRERSVSPAKTPRSSGPHLQSSSPLGTFRALPSSKMVSLTRDDVRYRAGGVQQTFNSEGQGQSLPSPDDLPSGNSGTTDYEEDYQSRDYQRRPPTSQQNTGSRREMTMASIVDRGREGANLTRSYTYASMPRLDEDATEAFEPARGISSRFPVLDELDKSVDETTIKWDGGYTYLQDQPVSNYTPGNRQRMEVYQSELRRRAEELERKIAQSEREAADGDLSMQTIKAQKSRNRQVSMYDNIAYTRNTRHDEPEPESYYEESETSVGSDTPIMGPMSGQVGEDVDPYEFENIEQKISHSIASSNHEAASASQSASPQQTLGVRRLESVRNFRVGSQETRGYHRHQTVPDIHQVSSLDSLGARIQREHAINSQSPLDVRDYEMARLVRPVQSHETLDFRRHDTIRDIHQARSQKALKAQNAQNHAEYHDIVREIHAVGSKETLNRRSQDFVRSIHSVPSQGALGVHIPALATQPSRRFGRSEVIVEIPEPESRSRSPMKQMFGPQGWLGKTADPIEQPDARYRKVGMGAKILRGLEKAGLSPKKAAHEFEGTKTFKYTVSLTREKQATLYMELELMFVTTANNFLMCQLRTGRISRSFSKEATEYWRSKGRPDVIEFQYDMGTQRDIVVAHQKKLEFYGPLCGSSARRTAVLSMWKALAKEMSIRTFCYPDYMVERHLTDAYHVLEMLGAPAEILASTGGMRGFLQEQVTANADNPATQPGFRHDTCVLWDPESPFLMCSGEATPHAPAQPSNLRHVTSVDEIRGFVSRASTHNVSSDSKGFSKWRKHLNF